MLLKSWGISTTILRNNLNQFWFIVNKTLGNKFQRYYNQNKTIFRQENLFENIVCKMVPSCTVINMFLYYVKLCASFKIHWCIQTGFTVQKHSIQVKIGDMLSRVTLKFDGWPWKTIGHLFYATSSFVHHFLPIREFKLELRSGNAPFGSKSTIFLAVWPRNFTDDPQKQ